MTDETFVVCETTFQVKHEKESYLWGGFVPILAKCSSVENPKTLEKETHPSLT